MMILFNSPSLDMNTFKFTVYFYVMVLLASCGGGGSGTVNEKVCDYPQQISQQGNACFMKAELYPTSYENFKSYATDFINYPGFINALDANAGWASPPKDEVVTPVAYGDFLVKGELSLFVAFANYAWWDIEGGYGQSYAKAMSDPKYLSDFTFWTINKDLTTSKTLSFKGCLHPRKAVVADFNQDGIPDVFVACHGYDGAPFPGEKSKLLLSNGQGNYEMSDVGEMNFTHGASAADVNGDGYPDIVVADLYFYINQKNGTFIKNESLIKNLPDGPYRNPGYFNIELLDLNGDGIVDIIAGGHEYNGQGAETKIWYGDSDGTFGKITKNIPPVLHWGVVNDFTFIKDKKLLYVNRTTDPSLDVKGAWYQGSKVQRVNLETGESVLSERLTNPNWVPWMIPKVQNGQTGVGPFDRAGFFK